MIKRHKHPSHIGKKKRHKAHHAIMSRHQTASGVSEAPAPAIQPPARPQRIAKLPPAHAIAKRISEPRPIPMRRSRPVTRISPSVTGIRVITGYPVYDNRKRLSPDDYYLNMDGAADIMNFQTWANGKKMAGLTVDGVNGPLTKDAYSKWGMEWEAGRKINSVVSSSIGTSGPIADGAAKPQVQATDTIKAPAAPAAETPHDTILDKFKKVLGKDDAAKPTSGKADEKKGMSTGTKVGLAVGGVVIFVAIVYYATRNK